MNVLVDTCVWSLSFRRRDKGLLSADEQRMAGSLADAVRNGRVLIIGPIRQEVLSGIRDKSQFAKIERLLDPFPDEPLLTADYIEAARLFNLCRDHGVECGPVDILICAVAVRNHCVILTGDQGLMRCIDVLRRQKLLRSRAE